MLLLTSTSDIIRVVTGIAAGAIPATAAALTATTVSFYANVI